MQMEYDILPNLEFGLELIIMSRLLKYIYAASLFFLSFSSSYAQEDKEKGMPPAQVVVSEMILGMIAPEVEFIGTIFYQEVSDVAAEVKGKVEEVLFEEGERIKKVISAPFGGVVIKKQTDRGEWLEPGGKVATIARDDVVEVIVNVSEDVMRFVKPGIDAKVTAAGKEITGKVSAIVPRGDIQTRTFPVKVRVKNG